MTWFLAGALVCSLLYIGRVLFAWRATTQMAYIAGWQQAMKVRDEWDKNRTVNAVADDMMRQNVVPINILRSRNLVN
jgi:hypothetical protein